MNMRKYMVILFIGLTIAGITGINSIPDITMDTLETTTADGVTISYNLYQPEVTVKTPVIILGHGIMVTREMMTNFAMEMVNQGYFVASLDWRGHGRSTGELSRDGLYRDLEAVISDIPVHAPLADIENIALLGYSMGGSPTFQYAADHATVKAWIGVGTAPSGISTETNPQNVIVIIARHDEAFSLERVKSEMSALTGVDVEFEKLYGSIPDGTARKIHVVSWVDHLTTPWNSDFVLTATAWVTETFEGRSPRITVMVFYQRLIFLIIGITGFVGFLFIASYYLAQKMGISIEKFCFVPEEVSVRSFIAKYYVVTIPLFFSMAVYLPLFLLPLSFAAFLAMVTGGLGMNILVYCRLLMGKQNFKTILRKNLCQPPRIWLFSIIVTVIFMVCYYFLIGLHYLGLVPSVRRIPYLILYSGLLFGSFWIYSFFIQKGSKPFLEQKLKIENPKKRLILISFINFVLIYSWFACIILVPCVIMGNFFFAMILILMVPIFLFMSFFSVYMEEITGSVIPCAVLHGVWFGFVITTLTPYVSSLTFMG
jgi:pimeloyl-ACP methyl ester carboxylesterase